MREMIAGSPLYAGQDPLCSTAAGLIGNSYNLVNGRGSENQRTIAKLHRPVELRNRSLQPNPLFSVKSRERAF